MRIRYVYLYKITHGYNGAKVGLFDDLFFLSSRSFVFPSTWTPNSTVDFSVHSLRWSLAICLICGWNGICDFYSMWLVLLLIILIAWQRLSSNDCYEVGYISSCSVHNFYLMIFVSVGCVCMYACINLSLLLLRQYKFLLKTEQTECVYNNNMHKVVMSK